MLAFIKISMLAPLPFMISTASLADSAASATLNWRALGVDASVSVEEMAYDDTAIPLDSVFDPFTGEAPVDLCYRGDINQICSLLSKMSKLSGKHYTNGGHGLSSLTGCRLQGHAKVVDANVKMTNDYEAPYKVHVIIEACAKN